MEPKIDRHAWRPQPLPERWTWSAIFGLKPSGYYWAADGSLRRRQPKVKGKSARRRQKHARQVASWGSRLYAQAHGGV